MLWLNARSLTALGMTTATRNGSAAGASVAGASVASGVAVGVGFLAHDRDLSTSIYLPLVDWQLPLSWLWYPLVFLLVAGFFMHIQEAAFVYLRARQRAPTARPSLMPRFPACYFRPPMLSLALSAFRC